MSKVKKSNQHVRHLPKSRIAETIGWFGAIAILIDYALLSLNILDGNSLAYHFLFLVGSAGLAIVTYRHRAFQSVMVNVIFILLAVIAISRIVLFA